jgi:hypothetical protein
MSQGKRGGKQKSSPCCSPVAGTSTSMASEAGFGGASRSMGLAASIVLSANSECPVRLVCRSTSCGIKGRQNVSNRNWTRRDPSKRIDRPANQSFTGWSVRILRSASGRACRRRSIRGWGRPRWTQRSWSGKWPRRAPAPPRRSAAARRSRRTAATAPPSLGFDLCPPSRARFRTTSSREKTARGWFPLCLSAVVACFQNFPQLYARKEYEAQTETWDAFPDSYGDSNSS